MWAIIPHAKDIDFPWALWYGKCPRSLGFTAEHPHIIDTWPTTHPTLKVVGCTTLSTPAYKATLSFFCEECMSSNEKQRKLGAFYESVADCVEIHSAAR